MQTIEKLTSLGQSLWYDNIQRKLLENGEFAAMIQRGDIRGMTSNPTIFNNAIAKSDDYDSALIPLAWSGWDAEKIFWQLAIEDIQAAADLFLPLYEETEGGDGYVSLEVSPFLANDTEATAAQAQQLWARVARPNLMVKIPATKAGIPAVRKAIAAGVNVNVTLIFSLARYAEVMDAYLSGLEDRLAAGHPIDHIASVASFFVSRVDTKIDARLPADSPLAGRAAIANAKLAYEEFRKVFSGPRFAKLQMAKARLQRPLWASTSTKNPNYPDTIYVDNLIGPATVNTVPPQTLDAFRDHGQAQQTLTEGLEAARAALADLEAAGISMDVVTQELEDEGVKAFADAFTQLLKTIDERRKSAASQLGPLADSVSRRVTQLEADSVPARLWNRDPALWTTDPAGQAEVKIRLGWLDSPDTSRAALPEIQSFAEEIRAAGIRKFLVLGMGGSSLTPEVLSIFFPNSESRLSILDSTDPAQVLAAARDFPPSESLYIVASKSGGTAEVTAMFNYFWELAKGDGSHFIAITDAGTSLETLARERGFRKIFNADSTVGGRYSALTHFGLVPAALLGVDLDQFLSRAAWMRKQCLALSGEHSRSAALSPSKGRVCPACRNPGLVLGAVMGESALAGRDKLTILADPPVSSFGSWIEQIIAESSGKLGRGIVPVDGEPVGEPSVYGADRLFVYLRQTGEHDAAAAKLRQAGFSVLEFAMPDAYSLAAEFYRWEVATATACHILGVNAFDQPDVQDAKDRTKAKIAEYQKNDQLPENNLIEAEDARNALNDLLAHARASDPSTGSGRRYIAVNAYVPRDAETFAALTLFRLALREKTGCATTVGFGPRFQHSTGQLHKGGADNGLFIQIVTDASFDVDIPTQGMTFGTLERAQALGDYEALAARGRRVLRLHLKDISDLSRILDG